MLFRLADNPQTNPSAARSCKTTRRFVWHHDFVLMIGGAAMDVTLKRFDNPDEVRTFTRGKFEIVHIGGMTLGPRDV